MATKKISDLVLRSDFDATCNVPVDDATQTKRVTGTLIKDYVLGTGNVGATALASDSVTTVKILDANVTRAKLAAGAVGRLVPTAIKTSAYTVTTADDLILVSGASGAYDVTLPTAVGITGTVFTIKRTDQTLANLVTINANASETIDGALTKTLATQYESFTICSDGANWYVLDHQIYAKGSSWTPVSSWVSNATHTGFWNREKNYFLGRVKIALTGAPTSATLTVNMPTGLVIDTTVLNGATNEMLGISWTVDDSTGDSYGGYVAYTSTSAVKPITWAVTAPRVSGAGITQAAPVTFANLDTITFNFRVPIVGWEA